MLLFYKRVSLLLSILLLSLNAVYGEDEIIEEPVIVEEAPESDTYATVDNIFYNNDTSKFEVPEDLKQTFKMQAHLERLNKNLSVHIVLDVGNIQEDLPKDVIARATNIQTGTIDYDSIYNWCNSMYAKYGSSKTFRAWNGNLITRPKGTKEISESFTAQELTSEVYKALITFEDKTITHTKSFGKDWIEVDLSNQKVFFWKDGICALSSDCVTGTSSMPTPEGTFYIINNCGHTRLKGPTWDCFVNNWAAFYGGCGLHDATWQSSFGIDRWNAGYGSHGCINLPLSVAKQMHNIIYVGEPIVIYYNN